MFRDVLLVGFGGFLGSVARYLVYLVVRPYTASFPLGTLAVNVLGCFLIGIVSGYSEKYYPAHSIVLLFLSTGLIGGFTTFSAFGLDTVGLLRQQQLGLAFSNIALSMVLGLGAVWIGRSLS